MQTYRPIEAASDHAKLPASEMSVYKSSMGEMVSFAMYDDNGKLVAGTRLTAKQAEDLCKQLFELVNDRDLLEEMAFNYNLGYDRGYDDGERVAAEQFELEREGCCA